MHKNDSIDVMVIKFTKITNGRASLGDAIDNDQKVRKSFMLYHHHGRSKLQH